MKERVTASRTPLNATFCPRVISPSKLLDYPLIHLSWAGRMHFVPRLFYIPRVILSLSYCQSMLIRARRIYRNDISILSKIINDLCIPVNGNKLQTYRLAYISAIFIFP